MTAAGRAALNAELRLDEGCRLHAYQDAGGTWTIGYGHTGRDVYSGLVWSRDQAEVQLEADAASAEAECANHLPFWARLDDSRQKVLANMAFNLGIDGLLRWRHMLAAVEAGSYAEAAADMLATEPWRSQVGSRADRLAAIMRTAPSPQKQAPEALLARRPIYPGGQV